jgi:hypothetical protein
MAVAGGTELTTDNNKKGSPERAARQTSDDVGQRVHGYYVEIREMSEAIYWPQSECV